MSYQVLARKWRPQTFADVVGQETVVKTLQNAIRSERIAHAFLFSGVRGVGKTTTARLLAKALNCHSGPQPEPCDECVSCREISAANCIDVLEIDAASNTGVDNIRDLRESVRYGTARDRFKIFIIDEVHMLSNAAFNALLKTLEEPPEHVKFILATTEHQKIPVTITSRCQQYKFRPIPFSLILKRLEKIIREEQIQISPQALRAIASEAEGSMRDAQSTLDQMIAFSGKEVEDDDVQALLGLVDERVFAELVERVAKRDRKGALATLRAAEEKGISPRHFCNRFLEYIRRLMRYRVGADDQPAELTEDQGERMNQVADQVSELDLIRFYDVVNRTENELRWQRHPEIHLEMAVLKLVEMAGLRKIEEVVEELKSGTARTRQRLFASSEDGPAGGPGTSPENTQMSAPADTSGHDGEAGNAEPGEAPPKAEVSETAGPVENGPEGPRKEPGGFVSELLNQLQSGSMGLCQHVQSAESIRLEGGRVEIRFKEGEQFHAERVEAKENRKRLQSICRRILDEPVVIEVMVETVQKEPAPEPTEDPRVRSFLKRYPGKVIVQKNEE